MVYPVGKNAYYLHVISGHPFSNELRHSMEENSHKIGEFHHCLILQQAMSYREGSFDCL